MFQETARSESSRLENLGKYSQGPRAKFILETLTEEELRIIDSYEEPSPQEYLLAAKAKRILADPELTDKFFALVPKDLAHFNQLQREWLAREKYLVGTKVQHDPQPREIVEDFTRYHNGPRFRIYYFLKFPRNAANPTSS